MHQWFFLPFSPRANLSSPISGIRTFYPKSNNPLHQVIREEEKHERKGRRTSLREERKERKQETRITADSIIIGMRKRVKNNTRTHKNPFLPGRNDILSLSLSISASKCQTLAHSPKEQNSRLCLTIASIRLAKQQQKEGVKSKESKQSIHTYN